MLVWRAPHRDQSGIGKILQATRKYQVVLASSLLKQSATNNLGLARQKGIALDEFRSSIRRITGMENRVHVLKNRYSHTPNSPEWKAILDIYKARIKEEALLQLQLRKRLL